MKDKNIKKQIREINKLTNNKLEPTQETKLFKRVLRMNHSDLLLFLMYSSLSLFSYASELLFLSGAFLGFSLSALSDFFSSRKEHWEEI